MSKLCKGLATVFGILGTLGNGIIAANAGNIQRGCLYMRDWGITIGIFLGLMLGVIIICVVLLTLGEILEKLEDTQYYIKQLQQTEKNNENKNSLEAKVTVSNAKSKLFNDKPSDKWICKKCGSPNGTNNTICKDCGTYK